MGLAALAALLATGFAGAQSQGGSRPDVAIRIDQALLETEPVREAQRRAVEDKVRGFKLEIREDGLHASGKYRLPWLPDVDFRAVAALVWTEPNQFEIRVRKLTVLGLVNATPQVLAAVKSGLQESLQGVCTFQELPEAPGGSRSLRVTVDMMALMPSLPKLALSGITTRDTVLILKARLP